MLQSIKLIYEGYPLDVKLSDDLTVGIATYELLLMSTVHHISMSRFVGFD